MKKFNRFEDEDDKEFYQKDKKKSRREKSTKYKFEEYEYQDVKIPKNKS